jgi:hypothetical protein
MGAKFTDDEPIYGRRIKIPRRALQAPLQAPEDGRETLVHLVSPMCDATTDLFIGRYACCLGLLDDAMFQTLYGDPSVTWGQWLLPPETVLTCLPCIQTEELERGRRNAAC